LLAAIALAGDENVDEEDRKVVYKQKTEIDFEGLEVEGVLQKPQGALVIDRRNASFNPLIKLRTDWNAEIDQSTNDIK
jgi:hypothetical protein